MKDADWDVLAAYVRSTADGLGLRDWTLLLKHDPPADQASLASVIAVEGRRFATIRVCTEFRELANEEQRQTIVHELLHCHLAESHHYLNNVLQPALGSVAAPTLEGHRLKVEYAVDAMAQVGPDRPADCVGDRRDGARRGVQRAIRRADRQVSASHSPNRRHRNTDAPPVPVGTCPKSGKVRWPTRAGARMQVRELMAAGRARQPSRIGVFRCDECEGWHVGHRRPGHAQRRVRP